MRISDWSSDVCSSDLLAQHRAGAEQTARAIEEELPRGGAGGEDRRDDLEQVAIDRAHRDAVAREPRRRRDDARPRQAGEILMMGEATGDRPRHCDGAVCAVRRLGLSAVSVAARRGLALGTNRTL